MTRRLVGTARITFFDDSLLQEMLSPKWYNNLSKCDELVATEVFVRLVEYEKGVDALIAFNMVESSMVFGRIISQASWGLNGIIMNEMERLTPENSSYILRSIFRGLKRFLINSKNVQDKSLDNINRSTFITLYECYKLFSGGEEIALPIIYQNDSMKRL